MLDKTELSKLVDKLYNIESQIDRWFDDNIRERLTACKSADEVRTIICEVSFQCRDRNNQMRDMLSSIHVAFCCKMSEFVE